MSEQDLGTSQRLGFLTLTDSCVDSDDQITSNRIGCKHRVAGREASRIGSNDEGHERTQNLTPRFRGTHDSPSKTYGQQPIPKEENIHQRGA
ncbi:hypothetical protein WAI453_009043 [Rhynchosporium graminicola]